MIALAAQESVQSHPKLFKVTPLFKATQFYGRSFVHNILSKACLAAQPVTVYRMST